MAVNPAVFQAPPLNSCALYGIISHHYAFFKSRMSAGMLRVYMAGNSHVKLHAYPSFNSMFISIQAGSRIGEIAGHWGPANEPFLKSLGNT